MKHGNAFVIAGAVLAAMLIMALFAPRSPEPKKLAPLQRSERSGIVISDARMLVDINRADALLLMELPGIGETLAGAIIAGRPYDSVEDLLRAKGIGASTIERIRGLITAGEADQADAG